MLLAFGQLRQRTSAVLRLPWYREHRLQASEAHMHTRCFGLLTDSMLQPSSAQIPVEPIKFADVSESFQVFLGTSNDAVCTAPRQHGEIHKKPMAQVAAKSHQKVEPTWKGSRECRRMMRKCIKLPKLIGTVESFKANKFNKCSQVEQIMGARVQTFSKNPQNPPGPPLNLKP